MNKIDIQNRDNLIIDIIKSRIGYENGIEAKEICNILFHYGYSVKASYLRNIIEKLRKEKRLPIWYKKGYGYFCFASAYEIYNAIMMVQGTIFTLKDTVSLLQDIFVDFKEVQK